MINVNGVWRDEKVMTNINGVWRETTPYVNKNGVWRQVNQPTPMELDVDSISHFRMVYTPAKWIRSHEYFKLEWNDDVYNVIDISGYDPDTINTYPKSLVFRFLENDVDTDGIYALEGILYAVIDDESIPISNIRNTLDAPDVDIKMDSSYSTESNGPHVLGWNRLFNSINNIPEIDGYSSRIVNNGEQVILPANKRSDDSDIIALIGIAREMKSHRHNMVGSHGVLTHNINACFVNGEMKPFSVELIL